MILWTFSAEMILTSALQIRLPDAGWPNHSNPRNYAGFEKLLPAASLALSGQP
jgi:hypothetical protein